MGAIGAITLYASTKGVLGAATIINPGLALFVVFVDICISAGLLIYKTRAAKKYGSVALKTDATNSIKDVLTSITAFIGITLNAFFGIPQTDAIAGIIISIFVFTMVHSIIKEASLALLDACQRPEIIAEIEKIAKQTQHVKRAHSIRMRKVGSYLIGDMQISVDGNMTVNEACEIASDIEVRTKQAFGEIMEFNVKIEPHGKLTKQPPDSIA
jgi:cation diffusion facilitator family transporter